MRVIERIYNLFIIFVTFLFIHSLSSENPPIYPLHLNEIRHIMCALSDKVLDVVFSYQTITNAQIVLKATNRTCFRDNFI